MSGPKSYSPPPRYSKSVFQGSLNKIFELQTNLNSQLKILDACIVSDPIFNIKFDIRDETKLIREKAKDALLPVSFNVKDNFGQSIFEKLTNEIESHIIDLKNFLSITKDLEASFKEKLLNYNEYLDFVDFFEQCTFSLDHFKSTAIQNLENYFAKELPEIFNAAKQEILEVTLDFNLPKFDFSFADHANYYRELLLQDLAKQEKQLNFLRIKFTDKVINEYKIIISDPSTVFESDESNKHLEQEISTMILNFPDKKLKESFLNRFQEILTYDPLSLSFHLPQLKIQIAKMKEHLERKEIISSLLKSLNIQSQSTHPQMVPERQRLKGTCSNLLDKSYITSNELSDIQDRCNGWFAENNSKVEIEEVISKERLFLKSQIVSHLKNMGYTVIDDLNVIDFEKVERESLLLKSNNSAGYLNLQFRQDGSFRYLFKSSKPVVELSTDQQERLLNEMKITCDDFQKVLSDLEEIGLHLTKNQETPATLDGILPLEPEEIERLPRTAEKSAIQDGESLNKKFNNRQL
jgi:hypothetical protein